MLEHQQECQEAGHEAEKFFQFPPVPLVQPPHEGHPLLRVGGTFVAAASAAGEGEPVELAEAVLVGELEVPTRVTAMTVRLAAAAPDEDSGERSSKRPRGASGSSARGGEGTDLVAAFEANGLASCPVFSADCAEGIPSLLLGILNDDSTVYTPSSDELSKGCLRLTCRHSKPGVKKSTPETSTHEISPTMVAGGGGGGLGFASQGRGDNLMRVGTYHFTATYTEMRERVKAAFGMGSQVRIMIPRSKDIKLSSGCSCFSHYRESDAPGRKRSLW